MEYKRNWIRRLLWTADVAVACLTIATITAACAGVRAQRPKHPVTLAANWREHIDTSECAVPIVAERRAFTWNSR